VIPEGSPRYNDLVDIVVQSVTKNDLVEQKDGSMLKQQVIDGESLWWKTNKIDSEKFGNLALELKEWERQAVECFNNMTYERATILSKQILDIGASIRSSIDAKSSESRRDKHNAKQTLVDTVGRNRVEHITTVKDEMKKGGMASFFGGKSRSEIDDNYD
jgi:hypothetical protein